MQGRKLAAVLEGVYTSAFGEHCMKERDNFKKRREKPSETYKETVIDIQ